MNIDVERLHALIRARDRAHAALLAATERAREDRDEVLRLETALARQQADVRNGRGGTHRAGTAVTTDPVAATEGALTRARQECARSLADVQTVRDKWDALARLADRCTRHAHKHCPGAIPPVARTFE